MPSAASDECGIGLWAGKRCFGIEQHQQPGGDERQRRGGRDNAARRRQRRLERHDNKPDRGERGDAAGRRGDRRHQSGQRQRRQHMRAFVAAGARQKISGEDRHHEPGEYHQLDRARRAAGEQIDRKRGQRDDAAEEPRRNKGAMARRRQRILLRRRVHQRSDIIAYWREEAHVPTHVRPLPTRSPCSVAGSCQTALKRTLKATGLPRRRARGDARGVAAFGHHSESSVAANGCHFFDVRRNCRIAPR